MTPSHPPLASIARLPVKALTVSQPFAALIATGEKWVENRMWSCGYRGPLAIHAGKGTQYLTRRELARYQTGGIIAVVSMVACIHLHAIEVRDPLACEQLRQAGIDRDAFLRHEHTAGPWCWVLTQARQCRFTPCRGSQGLWIFRGRKRED